MLKKILFVSVLLFNLLALVPLRAQAEDSVLPSGSLQSEEFMFDLRSITHEDVKEDKFVRGGLNFIFERAVTIMAATIGTAAVLMITVGGFMILASGGRQEWLDNGKAFIFKALIGLAVALGAYVMVQTIQILIKSIYA